MPIMHNYSDKADKGSFSNNNFRNDMPANNNNKLANQKTKIIPNLNHNNIPTSNLNMNANPL